MKKRIAVLSAVLAAAALAATAFGFAGGTSARAAEEPKYIDMYLIGGQSNAAGYSRPDGVTQQTFENVMYAGETDRQIGSTASSSNFITEFEESVHIGLGAFGNMGLEYGIAEALNEIYTADNKAILFKSAASGTSLLNENSGSSAMFGNWLPPSQRANYTANNATGKQYDVFIENFTTVYNKLVSQGYTPRVRGMAWMQGEQDRLSPAQYKPVIQSLIADVRGDLSEITGADLSQMPFVMGEISETFASASTNDVSINRAFNSMLHEIPALVPNTAVVESGGYAINAATGVVGSDAYHWSGPDSEQIGMLFADALLFLNAEGTQVDLTAAPTGSLTFTDGSVDYAYADGVVTFTPRPAEEYKCALLSVNGEALTAVNGVYTAEVSGTIEVKALFSMQDYYTITYRYNRLMGSLADGYNATRVGEGQTLAFKPVPDDGYEVESVTFNGTALTPDSEGVYTTAPVTDDGIVIITFRETASQPVTPPDDTQDTGSGSSGGCGGCGGAIAGTLAGTLAVAAAGLFLFVKKPL